MDYLRGKYVVLLRDGDDFPYAVTITLADLVEGMASRFAVAYCWRIDDPDVGVIVPVESLVGGRLFRKKEDAIACEAEARAKWNRMQAAKAEATGTQADDRKSNPDPWLAALDADAPK